jgi:hypothetical protein
MDSAGSAPLPGFEYAAEPGDSHHSPEAFDFIERCRTTCNRTHSDCQRNRAERILPPRLIRVEKDRLVLIDSVGLPNNTKYLALSYCWGKGRSLCTTSETMASFQDGIDFESVPPLLLDAAEVTRRLGEQYIWIDRLCIQQDDPLDWQENAAIMARIYEQSDLTVAAVTSISVDESFLRPADGNHRDERVSLAILWLDECKEQFSDLYVRARRKGPDISYTYDNPRHDAYPLDTRGWTFQERHLAQRSVRYLPHQIIWECSTLKHMETFPFDRFGPETSSGWEHSVQKFTKRSLSYASDRAAAISGLAARHHRLTNERYLSGLWQNGAVISQLLWNQHQYPGTSFCEAHSIPGAPSWSWLSITQPIIWFQSGNKDKDKDYANTIQIVDIDVRSSVPNPFGDSALPGTIVLEAGLLDATLRCQQQKATSPSAPIYKCTIQHAGRTDFSNFVSVDTHLELTTKDNMARWQRVSTRDLKDRQYLRPGSNAPIKLFAIATAKHKSFTFALMLSPLHGTSSATVPAYERIGQVLIDHHEGRMPVALERPKRTTFCIV